MDGQLTNEPLWPWPMEDRIQAELGISITNEMLDIFQQAGLTVGSCRDLTNDGVIDVRDIMLVSSHLGTTDPTYDFDGNGVVDVNDLSTYSFCWHRPPNPG